MSKHLSVLHVPATLQIADVLTRPLSAPQFTDLRSKLKMTCANHLSFEGGAIESKNNVNK